jgi:type IV secretory pathway TrbL component
MNGNREGDRIIKVGSTILIIVICGILFVSVGKLLALAVFVSKILLVVTSIALIFKIWKKE